MVLKTLNLIPVRSSAEAIQAGSARNDAIERAALDFPDNFSAGIAAAIILRARERDELPLGQFLSGSTESGQDYTGSVQLGYLDPNANAAHRAAFKLGYELSFESQYDVPADQVEAPHFLAPDEAVTINPAGGLL